MKKTIKNAISSLTAKLAALLLAFTCAGSAWGATAVVTTLKDMMTALKAGGTVQLGADITTDEDFPKILTGANAILDLNGHTLSPGEQDVIYVGGDLTIMDSVGTGKVLAEAEQFIVESCRDSDSDDWTDDPSVVVNSGTINCMTLSDGVTVTVNGGSVTYALHGDDYFEDWETESVDEAARRDYLTSITFGTEPSGLSVPEGYQVVQKGSVWKITSNDVKFGSDSVETAYASFEDLAASWGATYEDGVITLNGDSAASQRVYFYKDVTIDLNGYTLTLPASDSRGFYVDGSSSLTLKTSREGGRYVHGNTGCISIYVRSGSKLECQGGIYEADGNFIYNNGGTISIVDGVYTVNTANVVIWTASGTSAISGGYFNVTRDITSWVADGKRFSEVSSGTYVGYYVVENDPDAIPVAQIGDKVYYSLQNALNAGGEVTLLRNVVLAESEQLIVNADATLELNGFSVTRPTGGGNHMLEIYAYLTVRDSVGGSVISTVGNTKCAVRVRQGGTLDLKSGTISGDWYDVYNWSGTVIATGGTFLGHGADGSIFNYSGAAIRIGGTTQFPGTGIVNWSPSTVSLTGGSYALKPDADYVASGYVVNYGATMYEVVPETEAEPLSVPAAWVDADVVEIGSSMQMSLWVDCMENNLLNPAGKTLKLTADITLPANITYYANNKTGIKLDGYTIDGDGHTLTVTGASADYCSAIWGVEGTVKNLTIAGAQRGVFITSATGNVVLENVTFGQGTVYTVNTGENNQNCELIVRNSTLNGWTSFGEISKATFTDCVFTEGNGQKTLRPYVDTVVENSTFGNGFLIDNTVQSGETWLVGCKTEGDTAITQDQLVTILGAASEGTIVYGQYVAQIGTTKYETLAAAVAAVKAAASGERTTVTLLTNTTEVIEIDFTYPILIDGQGFGISQSTTAGTHTGIKITAPHADVIIQDAIVGNANVGRAVNILGAEGVTLLIKDSELYGNYYPLNVYPNGAAGVDNENITITNSVISGYCALNLWGTNGVVKVIDSTLSATNTSSYTSTRGYSGNDFGVIVLEGGTAGYGANGYNIEIKGSTIEAAQTTGNMEYIVLFNPNSQGNTVKLDGCVISRNGDTTHHPVIDEEANTSGNSLYVRNTTDAATSAIPVLPDGYAYANADSEGWRLVIKPVVAVIAADGVTTNGVYGTLEAAYDAASAGETITLLADITYGADRSVPVWTKPVNIDLGGHTLTTNSEVGKNLGNGGYTAAAICFSIPAASASSIMIYNGTIVTAYGAGVYADDPGLTLTLSNLTINAATAGTQSTTEYSAAVRVTYGSKVIIESGSYSGAYAIAASNSGADFEINGGTFTGDIFFSGNTDSGKTKSVTITDGTFNGGFVNGDKGTLAISGGTFPNPVPEEYCATGYIPTAQDPNTGLYTVKQGSYVAQVISSDGTTNKCETLTAALDAAQSGETIQLLTNINATASSLYSSQRIPISKSLVIDGQNHTITVAQRGFGVGVGAASNIDVTFKDVIITNGASGGRCVDTRGHLNSLTLDGATLVASKGASQPLTIGGNQSTKATVTVKDSTIATNPDGTTGYAVTTFNPVDMTVTNSTVRGWACFNIKAAWSSYGSSGSVFTISDSVLESKNTYGGSSNAYCLIKVEEDDVTVNLDNSTVAISGERNYQSIVAAVWDYASNGGLLTKNGDEIVDNCVVNITGGSYNLQGQAGFLDSDSETAELNVSDASFTLESDDIFTNVSGNTSISSGTFNYEVPEEVCAPGYIPTAQDPVTGLYTVKEGYYVAQIVSGATTNKYEALQAALDAVPDGGTVQLLTNITLTAGVEVVKAQGGTFVLDGAGYTITAASPLSNSKIIAVSIEGKASDASAMQLDVKNLTIESDGLKYGFVLDSMQVAMSNVVVRANGGTAFCANTHASVTIDDCTIANTGSHTESWRDTALAVSYMADVTVNSGTFTSENGWAAYIFTSGGTIDVKGGTFSGKVRSSADTVGENRGDATITISGGEFSNVELTTAHDSNLNATIAVSGGWFSAQVPAMACAEGFEPTGALADAPNAAVPYTVGYAADIIYPIEGTAGVRVTLAWATNNTSVVSEGAPVTAADVPNIITALGQNGANNMPKWESYVLGLNPADATALLRLTAEPVANESTKVVVSAVINLANMPVIAGTTVSFRLAARNGDEWATVESATPVATLTSDGPNNNAPVTAFIVPLDDVAGKVLAIFADIVTE